MIVSSVYIVYKFTSVDFIMVVFEKLTSRISTLFLNIYIEILGEYTRYCIGDGRFY